MRSNTASNDLHSALLAIAIGRARITELACSVFIFFYLGYLVAEKM